MARKTSKRFSVLLLYPDWMNESGSKDTFYGWTRADTRSAAVEKVQRQAFKANEMDADTASPEDFAELLVLPGHRRAL